MLTINNLTVAVDNKTILNGFNLDIKINEVHAIMGPNGIGKSTICKVIMGDPHYLVTNGSITFDSKNLLDLSVTERSRSGIFLLNQSPIEIPGVTNAEMLRLSLSQKQGSMVSIFEFNKKMEAICQKLDIPKSFIHRGINEGMSGGERKKNELLHLWMLEPKLIILDEVDSGLDVDSLKVVCENINEYKKEHDCSILIISHHPEILKMLNTEYVHILSEGKIVQDGDLTLADKIEKEGYKEYSGLNKVSDNQNEE